MTTHYSYSHYDAKIRLEFLILHLLQTRHTSLYLDYLASKLVSKKVSERRSTQSQLIRMTIDYEDYEFRVGKRLITLNVIPVQRMNE